jgi:hypothetical protein
MRDSHTARFGWLALALLVALMSEGPAAQQPGRPVELDAATVAMRADAARNLVPLLEDVKKRAVNRTQIQMGGGAPDSPFAGTQTTLLSMTVSKRDTVVDPQVIQAMDRLMKWQAGDRASSADAALFDAWLSELSSKATALSLQSSGGACDTDCVVRTMTQLNERWGESPRTRGELRDQALLEALTAAVKSTK